MSQLTRQQEGRLRAIRMNLLARSEFPNHRRMMRGKVNQCWDILQKNKTGEERTGISPATPID